jgi:hypothetical protein
MVTNLIAAIDAIPAVIVSACTGVLAIGGSLLLYRYAKKALGI